MLYLISQIGIVVFGVSSSFLIAKKNKWGFALALMAQPFWVIIGVSDGAWGVLVLSMVYSASSLYGMYVWFLKDTLDYAWVMQALEQYESARKK
jgi:Nicotinamide mononucleotide transporter